MKTVIFGCGKIANRVALGFEHLANNELVGFGSRDINKAKEYALKYNKPLYGNYDYFLNNNDIDAIYITTYNVNHYDLIKECLNHHKHVICEKPMLSSIDENEELFKLAKDNNCLLMEAMKAVFLPINIKIKQMIKDNVIGEIKYMEASFVRGPRHPEDHWIYDLKTGGALKDVGSYCAAILNFLTDKTPKVLYKYKNNTDKIADTIGEVFLEYDGIKAHIFVSNEITKDSYLYILGSKGTIKVENFWKVGKGSYTVDNQTYELNEELINDFHYELEHFSNLIENHIYESDIMSKEASNNILKITM